MARQSRKSRSQNRAGGSKTHPKPRTMTVRFSDQDTAIQEWLSRFAQTNDMSKVVKLACYLLAGIQPDEGMLALLARIRAEQPEPYAEPVYADRGEDTHDALAAVMQELAALRHELSEQRYGAGDVYDDLPPADEYAYEEPEAYAEPVSDSRRRRQARHASRPPTLPEQEVWPLTEPSGSDRAPDEGDFVASSGLDMGRRRKRSSASPPYPPAERDSTPAPPLDALAAMRILTQSARDFGQEYLQGQ